MYDNAKGDNWKEKLNSMRRDQYEKNKDKILAQKRDEYARRTEFVSVIDKHRNNAIPGEGQFKIEEGRKFKNREEENAKLIHRELGGDLSIPKESNTPGAHNPDYNWNGKAWEEQEPQAHTKNAIDSNVHEAIRQISDNPGGIILDIGDSKMPEDELKEIILHRLRRSSPYDCEVMIIRNGEIEDIYHYRKIKR